MSFLKGLALTFLSLLLFLSLVLFGQALTLNMTALNADFVADQIDSLDVPSLVNESLDDEEFPAEFRASLDSSLPAIESWAKEQLTAAIDPTYDYLLGRSQDINLPAILKDTVLDPAGIRSLLEDVDLTALVEDYLNDESVLAVPPGREFLNDYLEAAVMETVGELEPWVKDQAASVVEPVTDYLLGNSTDINVTISLAPVMNALHDNLRQAFLASPPPELAGLPPAQIQTDFNQIWQDFSLNLPASYDLDEALLGTEIETDFAEALTEAEEALDTASDIIGFYQAGFIALIAFILLTIGGIVLIQRNVRGSTRLLGIIFLIYGLIEYAGILIIKSVTESELPGDIPASLEKWLIGLTADVLAPLAIVSIVIMAVGAALLITSFVYRRQQTEA
ncbi:MAG: hypothetical protein V3S61_02345 [Dehalococcoidales bacterium]